MRLDDLIAAPITGSGRAAVCIIRISGEGAWGALKGIFSPFPSEPETHRVYYGRIGDLDDGLLTLFAGGRSYTGQESAELSVHGSPASVRRLLELLANVGARSAEPGEFTWRAFANGRIDLSQAESVRDTVDAETLDQLRLAHAQRGGALRSKVEGLRGDLNRILAEVEAHVDFSEELGDPDIEDWRARLKACGDQIQGLLDTAESGRILRQGLRIAILGRPNAGKSSLLNAVLGSDRAIVSPIPGTTRDYIEEKADLGGVPCVLIDTAGLRESEDAVESMGIDRAREIVGGADMVWYLYDAQMGWQSEDQTELERLTGDVVLVAAKSDLADGGLGLPVSSITRDGLAGLIESVQKKLPDMTKSFAIAPRHAISLGRALDSVSLCHQSLGQELPFDLASYALREALHDLGVITGETASVDMIERIFGEFCIGK